MGTVAQSERGDLQTYRDLIYPTLLAVASLGGSARSIEINNHLVEHLDIVPEQLEIVYEGKTKSVVIDRMNWARSYAKAMGALDSPQRSLYPLQPRKAAPRATGRRGPLSHRPARP